MSEITEKTPESLESEKRAQNAFRISIATGVIFTLITASIMLINQSARLDLSLVLVLSTALAAFFSAWLSGHGYSNGGILLIITGLLATIIGRVFVQKGLAIPTGISNVILVSTIAVYALPNKWVGRVVAVSFAVTLATIIIDQYTVKVPLSSFPEVGGWISLTLIAIYTLFLLRQFPKFNMRVKLIIGFLFLSIVPLVVLGWLTDITSRDILEEQIKSDLRESANTTSGHIKDFLTEQTDRLTIEASLADIVEYMLLPESEMNGSELERHALNALQTFASKDKAILSYSLIDTNGLILLDTVRANINSTYKDQLFFIEPLKTKAPYLSDVYFSKRYRVPVIYFSVPIFNADKQAIGILVATYEANILQDVLETAVENRSSGTEYTFLIDSVYFVNLGHSSNPELMYKTYQSFDEAAMASLQAQNILKSGVKADVVSPQPEIVNALRGMDIQTFFQAPSLENNGEMAESAAARIPGTEWIVVASQPLKSISTLTQNQTRATVTASIGVIIVAAIIALLASRFFTKPILELTQVAEKISAGDFTQKAIIRQEDEIGILGMTLNRVTEEIQGLIGTLEKRVAERTVEYENATQQSEKRARELQAIADISRHISTEKDMEKLLPLITQAVSERFGFYHVGIFLLNETKKFAVLRAANSPGGQVMLARQHKLEVGQTGIVGNVTASGAPRIALDTGADAIYFNNPDLPETHSEMALPLFARGEIIGALDVQSTERNAFSSSDIFNLSLLADQVAIAIENARLIEETQKALAESQTLFREYLTEAWQSKSASNVMGYYQTVTGGSIITKDKLAQADEIGADKNVLAVPIYLRGQAIGTLNILLEKSREELTESQINLVKSIVERLGLALENARLFEETSSRAARERLVTDITTKIRGTNNPQEMVKTAMEELKRALGVSRVEIIPQKTISQQDK